MGANALMVVLVWAPGVGLGGRGGNGRGEPCPKGQWLGGGQSRYGDPAFWETYTGDTIHTMSVHWWAFLNTLNCVMLCHSSMLPSSFHVDDILDVQYHS